MKVIFAYGSTRPQSVGQKVLKAMAHSAAQAGHKVLEYDLTQPLQGCRGCAVCRETGGNCCQQDSLHDYFNELFTADQLVICAPMYMGQAAGQCITFMNRHYCLKDRNKQNRLPEGIKVNVVFTQGAPADFPPYQAAQKWYFDSMVRYGFVPGEQKVLGGNSDLSENGPVMTWAAEWGKNL